MFRNNILPASTTLAQDWDLFRRAGFKVGEICDDLKNFRRVELPVRWTKVTRFNPFSIQFFDEKRRYRSGVIGNDAVGYDLSLQPRINAVTMAEGHLRKIYVLTPAPSVSKLLSPFYIDIWDTAYFFHVEKMIAELNEFFERYFPRAMSDPLAYWDNEPLDEAIRLRLQDDLEGMRKEIELAESAESSRDVKGDQS